MARWGLPLNFGPNKFDGEEKKKGKGNGKRKEIKEKRREKFQLLYTIYGDRWVGFRRSKN